VITDGYGYLKQELSERLKKNKTVILTILLGDGKCCSEFQPFGDVINLENIT
jgi:hypothetical protein